MAILAWVRFYELSQLAHLASTIIILPVIVIFVAFAVHFHRKLITAKCKNSTKGIVELEQLVLDLESAQASNNTKNQGNSLANDTTLQPLFPKQYNGNSYRVSPFDALSCPQKNNLMIKNGFDVVFSPINPLNIQQFPNEKASDYFSSHKKLLNKDKIEDILKSNNACNQSTNQDEQKHPCNDKTAAGDNPIKNESSQLINIEQNSSKTKNFFSKKPPNSKVVLDL